MRSCSERKDFSAADSEEALRETLMSTMEPEAISGGSRMEGNSIYGKPLASYQLPLTGGRREVRTRVSQAH